MDIGLFSQISESIRGNDFRLHHRRFRLDIRKNFINKEVVKHWNRVSREAMKLLSLGVVKSHVTVALTDMV